MGLGKVAAQAIYPSQPARHGAFSIVTESCVDFLSHKSFQNAAMPLDSGRTRHLHWLSVWFDNTAHCLTLLSALTNNLYFQIRNCHACPAPVPSDHQYAPVHDFSYMAVVPLWILMPLVFALQTVDYSLVLLRMQCLRCCRCEWTFWVSHKSENSFTWTTQLMSCLNPGKGQTPIGQRCFCQMHSSNFWPNGRQFHAYSEFNAIQLIMGNI